MKTEKKHLVAQQVADLFRQKIQRTHSDLYGYPLSLSTLTTMISETYWIAVQPVANLDIHKVQTVIQRLGGSLETSVLDEYSALAGFLYAYRGSGVIFIEAMDTEERQKFSLAHELGHFVIEYYQPIHLKYGSSNTIPLFVEEQTRDMRQVVAARCTKRDIYGDDEPHIVQPIEEVVKRLLDELQRERKEKFNEIRANLFAAEMLMPLEKCRQIERAYIGRDQEEIVHVVMRTFGVSRQAARYRVQELQLG